jgi:hypothetical protein
MTTRLALESDRRLFERLNEKITEKVPLTETETVLWHLLDTKLLLLVLGKQIDTIRFFVISVQIMVVLGAIIYVFLTR